MNWRALRRAQDESTTRRDAVVADLHELVEASVTVYAAIRVVQGRPILGELRVRSDDGTVAQGLPRFEGLPLGLINRGAALDDLPSYDTFSLWRARDLRSIRLIRLLDPTRAGAHLTMPVQRQGVHLGWLWAWRPGSHPFDRDDLTRARAQAWSLRSRLRRAAEAEQPGPVSAVVHTDGRGEVLGADEAGTRLVQREDLAAMLRARIVEVHAGGPRRAVSGGHLWSTSRLRSANGPGYLTRVSWAPLARVSPLARMSAIKRHIAQQIAWGRSTEEVGEAGARGQETVRSHLKTLYRQLGIGSRAELVDQVRAALVA